MTSTDVTQTDARPVSSLASMRLLVVEDDEAMASLLHRALVKQGYAVVIATDGSDALWNVLENDFDAVVLDAMIPAPDGFEVCRRMRAAGRWTPVLMLTARDSIDDRVTGLDAGADDYLIKPFALAELHARLRSLTRRDPRERPVQLRCGDLVLDPVTRQVTRADTPVELSPKEFGLLEELMRHEGEALSRTHLREHVWDFAYDGDSNVVDVYVRYLRNKLDRPFDRNSLQTVRGVGYRIVDERHLDPAVDVEHARDDQSAGEPSGAAAPPAPKPPI